MSLVNIIQNGVYFGPTLYDEYWNIIPIESDIWYIKMVFNETLLKNELVFTYVDTNAVHHTVQTLSPPNF